MLTHPLAPAALDQFALDVRLGLLRDSQKELPSKYFYDPLGSMLFDAICELPEYGLTRAEERILERHSPSLVTELPSNLLVAELGSGSGRKTRFILEALCRRQPLAYHPIEISPAALAQCERSLQDIRCLNVVGFEREYLDGLLEVAALRRPGQHLMVLFLGSTIGNFDGDAGLRFLRRLRGILEPGDSLLLGADLEKPIPEMLAAYDDALGVTAAFNRNLLVRINRELGADFDLSRFQHLALFNESTRSIEMHLVSDAAQWISIPRAGFSVQIRRGETIWTETSHKFTPPELASLALNSGFAPRAQWRDSDWAFTDNLWIAE